VFKDGGEFSINLSFFDIRTESMKGFLEELILLFKAEGRVTFEILESEGIEDYNIVKEFLDYFRKKYDVKIAIDDFGSGYSNFKRIMDLKPDFIKIDGSLIKDIAIDSNSYLLVKTIVSYAKELKIKVIAEYVHNKETFDTCKYLNIDLFQGYYLSPPMKLEEFTKNRKL
jgi:EAL domain-containing protein (putative c-di-GMP-specific phosphodiesterase class I)